MEEGGLVDREGGLVEEGGLMDRFESWLRRRDGGKEGGLWGEREGY